MVRFPPGFSVDDVIQIADELMADGGIVADCLSSDRDVFDVMAIEHAKLMVDPCHDDTRWTPGSCGSSEPE